MEQLVNQIIRKFDISEDGQRLHITTDEYRYYFVAGSQLRARIYPSASDEDVKAVMGQRIVRVTKEAIDQQSNGSFGDVIDTEFISLQTHAGDLDFELRTEHNGYYCGYITFVEKEKVWPVFDEIREEASEEFRR